MASIVGERKSSLDSSYELSQLAAVAADEKKATAIIMLDLEQVSAVVDYFVICNGSSSIQVRAIAHHIEDRVTQAGHKLYRIEGMAHGTWVLLDFGVTVVHVMRDREREFYNLERLWATGRMVPYQVATA